MVLNRWKHLASPLKAMVLDGMHAPPKKPYAGIPCHGVNLGNLYTQAKRVDISQPRGWAYFEDGSVFVPRRNCNHDELQRVMNIAAFLVREPAVQTNGLKKSRSSKQMIVLEKSVPGLHSRLKEFHAYARYADAEEDFCTHSENFQFCILHLDPTEKFLVSTDKKKLSFRRSSERDHKWKTKLLASSRVFRGTLNDGVLQPNVRPNNGLVFSINPSNALHTLPLDAQAFQQDIVSRKIGGQRKSATAVPMIKFVYTQQADNTSNTNTRPQTSYERTQKSGTSNLGTQRVKGRTLKSESAKQAGHTSATATHPQASRQRSSRIETSRPKIRRIISRPSEPGNPIPKNNTEALLDQADTMPTDALELLRKRAREY